MFLLQFQLNVSLSLYNSLFSIMFKIMYVKDPNPNPKFLLEFSCKKKNTLTDIVIYFLLTGSKNLYNYCISLFVYAARKLPATYYVSLLPWGF